MTLPSWELIKTIDSAALLPQIFIHLTLMGAREFGFSVRFLGNFDVAVTCKAVFTTLNLKVRAFIFSGNASK